MNQRDRLFGIICGIKYTAIYGDLYARRIERLNLFATAFLAFAFSGTFCSFWLWQEHSKSLATVMLGVTLLNMLHTRRGFDKQAMRIRIACGLLDSLYGEAVKVWNDVDKNSKDDNYVGYSDAADTLRDRENQCTAIANPDVRNDDKLVSRATELMKSQIKYDFNL
ncbi:MAG: hypothetical protein IKP00_10150 [Victivallales bacterium]|nr:hypothetical protein [Victivallales bacterium]